MKSPKDIDVPIHIIAALRNYTANGSDAEAQINGLYSDLESATKDLRLMKKALQKIVDEALCDCLTPDGHDWKCHGTCPLAIATNALKSTQLKKEKKS
jgi:hypothetical protein